MDTKMYNGSGAPGTTRRESRKIENKKRILATAEEFFLEKGYSATTTDEIAERAGVTKRTLYSYFPSKMALFINMFDRYLKQLSIEIGATSTQETDAATLIYSIFDVLFNFTKKNEKFMRLYWMLDSEEFEGDLPKELVKNVNEHTRNMFKSVTFALKRAQKEKQIIDIDPLMLAHLMSAINKGIFTHASKERRFDIAEISQDKLYELLKVIVKHGLFPERSKTKNGKE